MHHQQPAPNDTPPRARALLACLVGLPGAGKTTAAAHLAATGAAHGGASARCWRAGCSGPQRSRARRHDRRCRCALWRAVRRRPLRAQSRCITSAWTPCSPSTQRSSRPRQAAAAALTAMPGRCGGGGAGARRGAAGAPASTPRSRAPLAQACRRRLLRTAEQLLAAPPGGAGQPAWRLVLADDNHQYASMRWQLLRLARARELARHGRRAAAAALGGPLHC